MTSSTRDQSLKVLGMVCVIVPFFVFVWLAGAALVSAFSLPGGVLGAVASSDPANGGLLPALVGSLWLVTLASLIALPIGLAAAIYLEEVVEDGWLADVLEANAVVLAAVPSVVWGVFGAWVWVRTLAMGESLVAGAFTLSLLMLPLVMVTAREALRRVPLEIREAAVALGATRWQTLRGAVLPTAIPGVLTGVVLSVSRAIGEAAPLLLVGALAYVSFLPPTPASSYTALPVQVYAWLTRAPEGFAPNAAAGVIVLLVTTVGINAAIVWKRASREEGR